MIRELLIVFFLVNAVFWGLFPHSSHCRFVSQFTDMRCPPHFVHISIGIISFLVAILLSQQEYVMEMFNDAKDVLIGAGYAVKYAKEQFDTPQTFRHKLEQFANGKK
jgi:hypothetical protein